MAAPQTANPGTRGQDSRYDSRDTVYDPNTGLYVDDEGWHYREQGLGVLSEDRPSVAMEGLFPADDDRSRPWEGSGGGGGGGGGGSFGGDLTANPYYQQYDAQMKAQDAADLAGTNSALAQLLIAFGLVPEGFQDKYGALTDTVRSLIQKNTDTGISQYARLLERKKDAQRVAFDNLSRRRLLRSGAKGNALRRGALDFDRTLSDALGQVTGQATGLQTGYASRAMERQSGLTSLLSQIAASYRPPTSFVMPRYSGGPSYTPARGTEQAAASPAYSPPPAPTYAPEVSQPSVPFFNVPGGRVAGGVLRSDPELFGY